MTDAQRAGLGRHAIAALVGLAGGILGAVFMAGQVTAKVSENEAKIARLERQHADDIAELRKAQQATAQAVATHNQDSETKWGLLRPMLERRR